ncbi:MAG: quinoprotein relay system zinc metallohydrolase 2 [Rhodoferax sp.]|nr:quinoprotein relay system zinc metallohydrolase 2 [Rhodoferax sp.]
MHCRHWPRGRWLAVAPLLSWLLGACVPGSMGLGAAPLAIRQVQPGVFVHTGLLEDWTASNAGDVANTGFVVGSRCVAVIDTGGTPAVGEALRQSIARTTPLPVCYVINTHAHPDHMLGNAAFARGGLPPQFVTSARFAATLSAREPYYRGALRRDFGLELGQQGMVYPTISVARTLDLDLGDRILTLQAWPTAHTDNDLSVFDQRSRTLFAGNLLFVQHLPVLDGNLHGWLCAMDALQSLAVGTVVPGHGLPSHDWPAALDAQRAYLSGLLRDTRSAIREGLTLQQTVDRVAPSPAFTWLLTERFQRRNVTAAYAEPEWEEEGTNAAPCAAASRPIGDAKGAST